MKAQRLRFRYRLTSEACGLRQREIVDAWADAVKAAGLSLAHSEGKRVNALISLAAPLPQGVTSDWEIVDIFLEEQADPRAALRDVQPHLPPGVEAVGVTEAGVSGPSLQSQLRWAEYEADVPAQGLSPGDVQAAIDRLLAADTLPSEYRRETKVREYDLRPLILGVQLDCTRADTYTLRMKLRAEPESTARADQVVSALGLPAPTRVHRSRLQVEETPAVLAAYRRSPEG